MLKLIKQLFALFFKQNETIQRANELAFNNNFANWLVVGERKKTISILVTLSSLFIVILFVNFKSILNFVYATKINGYASLIFVEMSTLALILYGLMIRNFDKTIFNPDYFESNKSSINKANTSIESLNQLWNYLWISWLILYILVIAQEIYSIKGGKSGEDSSLNLIFNYILPFSQTFVNNIGNGIMLSFYCIFAYAIRFDSTKKVITSPGAAGRFFKIIWGVIFSLAIVHFILALAFSNNLIYIDLTFGLISGLIGSVSLSLFIGRVDSKFFHIPLPALLILYGYSAIQLLYPLLSVVYINFIKQDPALIHPDFIIKFENLQVVVKIAIIAYAFFAKFVLLAIFRWLNGTKRLFLYFLYFNQTNTEIKVKMDSIKEQIDFEKSK